MRIDKYLKVSRIIKRRSVAKTLIEANRVYLNDKIAKASNEVKINDIIVIEEKNDKHQYRVVNIFEFANEEKAKSMYEEIK